MAMTRVCLYTRISTDEESQPTSLHSQRARLEAFCTAQEGWRIIAHQEDRATGTKLDRPGLQAALDLARSDSIDLLVYRVDRLSRSTGTSSPTPRTAPVVKRIFDLYTRGRLGTAAIARTLAA
jgi:DNA invertase Pin-like site-specific DNA recombinase